MIKPTLLSLSILLAAAQTCQALGYCDYGPRTNCVVDGDTFWLKGEKIRMMNIDAPELGGRCTSERVLAAEASGLLLELLSSGEIEVERHGQDHYGRTLGVVIVDGLDVGEEMISQGKARRWAGKREDWCQ